MLTPEGHEKKDIDKYLKTIGAYVVKPTTGGYGESGHSDRICCIKGWFVVIEVKRPGKEPTAIQWRRMRECEASGGNRHQGGGDGADDRGGPRCRRVRQGAGRVMLVV